MYSVVCPICQFVNPADAHACKACSTDFFLSSDHGDLGPVVTATRAQRRGLRTLSEEPTGLASAAPQTRSVAPSSTPDTTPAAEAARHGRRAIDLTSPVAAEAETGLSIHLLDLQGPLVPPTPVERPLGLSAETASSPWPSIPGLEVRALAEMPRAPLDGHAADTPNHRLVAKAMARQAARRARMASLEEPDAAPPPVDVLLLDEDERTRGPLLALLEQFGFQVHEAWSLAQAERLAEAGPFAAAFIDIVLDGSDGGAGLALCQHLQRSGAGPDTPVLLMTQRARPADRVRAALARGSMLLPKPLSRGDVARALESCGVLLPADARRH